MVNYFPAIVHFGCFQCFTIIDIAAVNPFYFSFGIFPSNGISGCFVFLTLRWSVMCGHKKKEAQDKRKFIILTGHRDRRHSMLHWDMWKTPGRCWPGWSGSRWEDGGECCLQQPLLGFPGGKARQGRVNSSGLAMWNNLSGLWAIGVVPSSLVPGSGMIKAQEYGLLHTGQIEDCLG